MTRASTAFGARVCVALAAATLFVLSAQLLAEPAIEASAESLAAWKYISRRR